jgi:hypothetical protein
VSRWDCWCGATGVAGRFCPWCGRRDPGSAPPPLPGQRSEPPANWGTPPERDAGGPRVGLTPVTRVLGTVLTALLILGGVTVERRRPEPSAAGISASQETPPSAVPTTAPPRDVERAVADGKAFVEEFRGRPFTRHVEVALLGDAAFRRELLGEDGDDPAEGETQDDFHATLVGLGLADPGDDIDSDDEALVGDSVVGFYDDEAERLVVRAREMTPYAERTLVHELAHAWQDQQFDLESMWDKADSQDEALAIRALIEGDAERTENAWYEAQPESVQDEIDEEEDDLDGSGSGRGEPSRATVSLNMLYGFPYAVGERFADALAKAGELDAAFADPPVSTAQVLHADKYLDDDVPANPVDPVPHGRVVDRGTLGEAGLIVMLSNTDLNRETFEVAATWDGDEYVTWVAGARTCTAVSMSLASESDQYDVVETLRKAKLEVTANGANGVTFVRCAAGSG